MPSFYRSAYTVIIAGAVSMSYSYISGRSTRTSALPLTMASHLGACIERIEAWARKPCADCRPSAAHRNAGAEHRRYARQSARFAEFSIVPCHVDIEVFREPSVRSRFRRSMHREERAATAQLRRDSEEHLGHTGSKSVTVDLERRMRVKHVGIQSSVRIFACAAVVGQQ